MLSFTSPDIEPTPITGRSMAVYGILPPYELPDGMWDPVQLRGQTVEINGQPHEIVGVETFCIMRSAGHPYKLSFGLGVRWTAHMRTWPSWALDEPTPMPRDRVRLEDVRPGLQFTWEHPHLTTPQTRYVFEVLSYPQDDELGLGQIVTVRYVDNPSGDLIHTVYLSSAGVVPMGAHDGGKWNTNWLRILKRAPRRKRQQPALIGDK